MNTEKAGIFCLMGLLPFSECSGMEENQNFQQQKDQQTVNEYYYPARENGSFIGNLGLLFYGGRYSDDDMVIDWKEGDDGLVCGCVRRESIEAYIAVFVKLPEPGRRWVIAGLSAHPVVRVMFKYFDKEFDTGADCSNTDYRNDNKLGVPFELMHILFPECFF